MIRVETIKVALPLKKKFAIAGGEASEKTNLITILNNRYSGEAAASVKYGPELKELEADLRKGITLLRQIKKLDLAALDEIGHFDISPTARSALSGMVLNYLSGESGRYPWEVVSLGRPVGIKNSITISIEDPQKVIEAIKTCFGPVLPPEPGTINQPVEKASTGWWRRGTRATAITFAKIERGRRRSDVTLPNYRSLLN